LAVSFTEAISPPSVTPENGVIPSPRQSFKDVATNFPILAAFMVNKRNLFRLYTCVISNNMVTMDYL